MSLFLASQPLLETLVDSLPVGVVLLDRIGRVVLFNRYEERLAGRRREDVVGKLFFESVAPCTNSREIAGVFRERIDRGDLDETVDFVFKIEYLPRPREVKIRLRSVPLGGEVFAAFMVEDVTEQRRLERERDSIHSILIHDLRGDLGGVLGYADLLASGSLGPLTAEQVEAARTIHEAGGKMVQLIESQLRDYRAHKARGSPEGLKRDPVNLHAVVLSSLALSRPQAARAGIEVVYEQAPPDALFPDRAVAVLGDVDRLGALVDNLLSNALKYARSRVFVSLEETRDGVSLSVRDDGRGIAEAYREQVFEGGFQAPGSAAGHGLGLLSARRTATAHGGRIWVETAPEGGAALRVVLPRFEGRA